jgi:DNA-binding transcriptional MocR family regulator
MLRERNRRRRKIAVDAVTRSFPAGSKVWSQRGGYMLWVELPPEVDLARARERAAKEKVVFAAGDVFFPVAPQVPCVRLNSARANEADLVKGLEILGAALQP